MPWELLAKMSEERGVRRQPSRMDSRAEFFMPCVRVQRVDPPSDFQETETDGDKELDHVHYV